MISKHKDNKQDDIDYLSDLLERDISDDKRQLIDRELKNLYSGAMGDQTAEYYLDEVFKKTKNWAVIHDLRIEHGDHVAQIDHLLIGRKMDIYIIESKNFTSGLSISDAGNFSYFYNNEVIPVDSPILQNERAIQILDSFLTQAELIPKRLGITLKPTYRNIILISEKSRLIKPKKGLYDCSAVMYADKFTERFKNDVGANDAYDDMASIANVTSQDNLQRFAEKLVLHHKPVTIDYRLKFSLQQKQSIDGIKVDAGMSPDCPVCGKLMVMREAKKGKNEGKKFWGCQQFPKCRGVIELDDNLILKSEQDSLAQSIDNKTQPKCPKCQGVMVKRVSKKGKNAGQEFWGCQDFPNCRGVVSISNISSEH